MSVNQILSSKPLESDRIEMSIRRDTDETKIDLGRKQTVNKSNLFDAAKIEFVSKLINNESNPEFKNESNTCANKPQVSRTWYTDRLTATVSAMVQTILMLMAFAGLVFGKISKFVVNHKMTIRKLITDMVNAMILEITIMVLILGEMTKFMVYIMWVVYRILEIALPEIFYKINKVFGIDLIIVMSNQTRNQMVNRNKVYMAAMARKTLNMEQLRRATVTKQDTLTAKQNEMIIKYINETSVNKCEEKPETNTNVETIEEFSVNETNTQIVDLVSFVYSPSSSQNVSCRDDKLAKWRKQRFFTDDATTITLTQSNNQNVKDLTEKSSNTRNDDVVFPASPQYVPPAVFSRVDKMAKWRPWRYFIARKQPVLKPSIRHNQQTQYRHHWRGPTVWPRDQSFMASRTPNSGFNTHVPRIIVPPLPPNFGQFRNGYRDYGVPFRPRIGQFRPIYRPHGMYTVPPLFHQWPQTYIGQRTSGPHNGFHLEYQNRMSNTYTV